VNFRGRFSKYTEISNVMKNHPMEAELFHADGRTGRQTDMMKLPVTVRNSANVLERGINIKQCFKVKMRGHKLRNGVYWQGVLQKVIKHVGHRGRNEDAIRKVQYKIIRRKFSGIHCFLLCTKGFRKCKHHVEKHVCLDIN
jgi:hypothetical protein